MMWEEIVLNLGISAVEKFFERKKKRDSDAVSIGLAVGYYYNFLEPISAVIEQDDLVLYNSKDDSKGQGFEAENVKVQIIVPLRLDVNAYKNCEDEFKKTSKGFIFLKRNKRYYGINYGLTQLGNNQELIIIDLARPLMAVKRYYEDILNFKTHDQTDKKWLKTQITEITAFKESIRRLQKRGYGALVNQLDFRERG